MVKLPDYTNDFVMDYCKDVGEQIYKNASYGNNISFWNRRFPDSKKNAQFFYDIISLDISESCKKYSSVYDYYRYAFFSSLALCRVHNKEKSRVTRERTRVNYIVKYLKNNSFIDWKYISYQSIKDAEKSDKLFVKLQSKMKAHLKQWNVDIEKSISYKKMIKKTHRVAILDALKIKVCPYCNRQYVIKLDVDMGKPMGDIDHFYPKSYFALFELSLYNFVPSCKICNSLFKSDINADIQYPYGMKDDSNIEFQISNSQGKLTPGNLYGWNDDFSIDVISNSDNPESAKVKREIELFALNEQYSIHKDYAREFLYKKNVINTINKKYLSYYLSKFGHYISDKDINEILYGFDVDNIVLTEKPLAKLTKDLYEKY